MPQTRPEDAAGPAPRPAKSLAVQQAEQIVAGLDIAPKETLTLITALKAERAFGIARKALQAVLARYADNAALLDNLPLRTRLLQALALCTYKDPDLAGDERLDAAMRVLEKLPEPLAISTDQETLGLAGAICRRRWELRAHRPDLEMALAYYARGHDQGVAKDFGYTTINAAFVEDLLAVSEAPASHATDERRQHAQALRQQIVDTLPGLIAKPGNDWLARQWWFLVTLAEASFGLERFDDAAQWLQQAMALNDTADWERESSARQLARLAWIRYRADVKGDGSLIASAANVLTILFPGKPAAVTKLLRGKTGLALSGGGFRASLYHIGVLAKLAEYDLLRDVEYLSCVSGGSIIGAHYYLEMRLLLQRKADEEITQQDYVDLVKRVERDFLEGVQRNIRIRVAAEWLTSLRLIFSPGYSRSTRAGELYESEIFSRVQDGEGGKPRWIDELTIQPMGEPAGFQPKDHNWRRLAKVPILVINATALNTGHNWQFTASWMGEPPAGIDGAIDANYRLRRMYYGDAPAGNRKKRLGDVVGASACVPGIFEPLPLYCLYPDITVRLVDGGVHDNQGTGSLLEQGCTVLLVSDASGQMASIDEPSTGLIGVPLRANSILQARVREAQFRELDARRRAGLLQGLMFIHLKLDLETVPKDWIDCQDVTHPQPLDPLLPYGIQRQVQRRLAAIRTDLDSFSEVEAFSLMTSGYRMTGIALRDGAIGDERVPPAREDWRFLGILRALQAPGIDTPLMRQLAVADKIALKIWLLSRKLQLFTGAMVLALFVVLVAGLFHWPEARVQAHSLLSLLGTVAAGLLVFAIVLSLLLPWAGKKLHYRKTLQDVLIGIGMAAIGFLVARLHLHFFDRWFLRQGRLSALSKKD